MGTTQQKVSYELFITKEVNLQLTFNVHSIWSFIDTLQVQEYKATTKTDWRPCWKSFIHSSTIFRPKVSCDLIFVGMFLSSAAVKDFRIYKIWFIYDEENVLDSAMFRDESSFQVEMQTSIMCVFFLNYKIAKRTWFTLVRPSLW